MKIARIVLTATMLLSLKSTLFCSNETPQIKRIPSLDALRDANGYYAVTFGGYPEFLGWSENQLEEYTIDNCGKMYRGKQIRPGSDEKSIAGWKQKYQNYTDERLNQAFVATLKNNVAPEHYEIVRSIKRDRLTKQYEIIKSFMLDHIAKQEAAKQQVAVLQENSISEQSSTSKEIEIIKSFMLDHIAKQEAAKQQVAVLQENSISEQSSTSKEIEIIKSFMLDHIAKQEAAKQQKAVLQENSISEQPATSAEVKQQPRNKRSKNRKAKSLTL